MLASRSHHCVGQTLAGRSHHCVGQTLAGRSHHCVGQTLAGGSHGLCCGCGSRKPQRRILPGASTRPSRTRSLHWPAIHELRFAPPVATLIPSLQDGHLQCGRRSALAVRQTLGTCSAADARGRLALDFCFPMSQNRDMGHPATTLCHSEMHFGCAAGHLGKCRISATLLLEP
jgi:hypothetical protein